MRNPKLRALTALAAAGLLAATLVGCGDDNGNGAEPTPDVTETDAPDIDPTEDPTVEPTEEPADNIEGTIRVRWWGGETRQENQMAAIELFETLYPGITVVAEPSSMDGYLDALTVEMAARNAPDVMALGGSWPVDFGSLGGLLNVMALPGLDMGPFPPATLTDATIGNEVFAVPRGANAWGILVNVDIFEEAGVALPNDNTWTWGDFVDVAAEIAANTPDGTFGSELNPQELLGVFAGQRGGGGLYNAAGELIVADSTLIDYFNLFLDLQETGAAPPATLAAELFGAGIEETLMGRGLAGMGFVASNQLAAFADSSGANMVLMRVPGETEFVDVGTTILPSQFWGIAANTEYPEAAAAFVNFMVNNPEAALIMGPDPGNPINEVVAEAIMPTLDDNQQAMVAFVARVGQYAGIGLPQPPGSAAQPALSQRMVESVLFGQLTAEAAASQWLVEMQDALDAGAID